MRHLFGTPDTPRCPVCDAHTSPCPTCGVSTCPICVPRRQQEFLFRASGPSLRFHDLPTPTPTWPMRLWHARWALLFWAITSVGLLSAMYMGFLLSTGRYHQP